ncbi:MAG TPA: universal stress protein [Candidatus Thermoplasmatota archaeon]
MRTTATRPYALQNVLLVVEWGGSPVNLIHWTLALAEPSTRVSVMCVLDSSRAAPARVARGPSHQVDVKWRPGRNRLVEETCAQLRAGGLQANPIYRDGEQEEAVLWAAEASHADLVIVTAAFADRFHGKPLTRIKHGARTSFLFARSSRQRGPILLADDFTAASRQARLLASVVAQKLDVPLRITSEPSEARNEPVVAVSTRPPPGAAVLRSELMGTQTPTVAVADEILRQAEAQQAQLIVVGNSHRGSVRRFLFGSVSDDVASNARTSVLVATPDAG